MTNCLDNNNDGLLPSSLKNLVFAVYDSFNITTNEDCDCSPNTLIDFKPYNDRTISREILNDYSLFSQQFQNVLTPVMINSAFQNLFYSSSSKSYNINASQKFNPAIVFGSQTIALESEDVPFSLFDACCDAFSEKNGCVPDPIKIINLNKELIKIKTLYDLKCNTKALSYDGIINYYVSTNQIKKQECKPDTKVVALPLSIQVHFYSTSLDVKLLLQFNYLVSVPGYDIVKKNTFELPVLSPNDIMYQVEKTTVLTSTKKLGINCLENLNHVIELDEKVQCELSNDLIGVTTSEYNAELKGEQEVANYCLSKYEQDKSLELIQPLVCSIANNYDAEKNYQLSQIEVHHVDTCLNKYASSIEGTQKQLGLESNPYTFPPLDLSTQDYLSPLNLCTELNPPQIQKLVIVPPPLNDCGTDCEVDGDHCNDT